MEVPSVLSNQLISHIKCDIFCRRGATRSTRTGPHRPVASPAVDGERPCDPELSGSPVIAPIHENHPPEVMLVALVPDLDDALRMGRGGRSATPDRVASPHLLRAPWRAPGSRPQLEKERDRFLATVVTVVTYDADSGEISNDSASAPGRTRTCDQRLRRPLLYPTELRALDERR
jgi:hypothetical protein